MDTKLLLSGNVENYDPEEAAFYFWLSESKEWVQRYGVNAVIEMMMQQHYEPEVFNV